MNKQKIYLFSFFWMFLVVIPIAVPYFQSLGLSMSQIFQLQAIYGLAVAMLEVPTGYLGDLFSRKFSMIVGAFISGVGFTVLACAHDFYGVLAFELLAALGNCFVSGSDVSLLYDSFDANHPQEATHALANLQFSSNIGEAVASLCGGFLATFSLYYPVLLNLVTAWIPLLIAISLTSPAFEKMDRKKHRENFREVFHHLLSSKDPLLLSSFINQIIWGVSTFIAVWMFQKYWQEEHVPLAMFGVIWALYMVASAVVGKQVHHWEKKWGPSSLVLALSLAPIVGYLGMGFLHGTVGVLLGFLFYFSRGVTNVLLLEALNNRTPAKFRATVNSLRSLFFRLSFAVVGPAVGYCIDRFGIRPTLTLLGVCFAALFFVTAMPLARRIKKGEAITLAST